MPGSVPLFLNWKFLALHKFSFNPEFPNYNSHLLKAELIELDTLFLTAFFGWPPFSAKSLLQRSLGRSNAEKAIN